MELGQRLKEAREEQQKSLDDIQTETKIQKRYLSSIEANDWSTMPGNFYVRAFVREYAAAVGLNGDELLEEHQSELPQNEERKYDYVTPSRKNTSSSKKSTSGLFNVLPKILVFLLLIAIIFGIWYAYVEVISPAISGDDEEITNDGGDEVVTPPEVDDEESDESESSEEEESEEAVADESDEEQEEEAPEPSLEVVETDNSSGTPRTTYQLNNADSFDLELEASGENWLGVSGIQEGSVTESYYEAMFDEAQSPLSFDLSEESAVRLNIGNASALTIIVNGNELEYEVDPNDEVRQYITIEWNQSEE
ncbi:helix-turn-helix domain-containing protein [Halalkalibacillus sediminis]|uniref:Helix-turn-helix domain-containing protein n=1 Tax=Halalkalibacillus sediminis TaxID=2018042 RepID=A0A2I0QWG3_9BACI|nr:helix-turn-helix domain-containing protein [Halalkalibacillus sediminis]PKR78686.1 helix-turn-helix domain-containing protein [Halalkalibacillus sediminis]